MAGENGGRAWIGTVAALGAVTIFGTTAGGIAGYERAQAVADQQRQWFEERLAALREEVAIRRTEIRAEYLDERRALEERLVQRMRDQDADAKERIEAIEALVYGRSGGAR